MSQVKRLGMGLGALIGGIENEPAVASTLAPAEPAGMIDVASIHPNPYQPRAEFDEKDIQGLADSVRREGLLQPVVVRPAAGGLYQLVAGERRWRASKVA